MQVRKYSPTRFFPLNTPVAVLVSKLPVPRIDLGSVWRGDGRTSPPDDMSPPSARTRVSKGAKLKAVRRYASPQPAGTESRVAGRSNARELQVNGHGGGGLHKQPPPRSRRSVSHPDVRTIFSLPRDPRVREETGEGHCFVAGESATWCDVCCGYIVHDCRVCSGCKYTCHAECQHLVALDCQPGEDSPTNTPLSDQLNNNTQLTNVEKDRERRTQLSREEIRQKVEQYNALTKDHLKMTLNASGVYTGFIKVQLELRRPVTVRGGRGPVSGEEAFYLPLGSTNTLHISSNNTVKQVIVALLNKFTVADNPAKYALYKRYSREEQVYVCKLAEGEQPLFLRLVAGPDADTFGFVLREQKTGEFMWDAFSIPELRNFLRILEKEEKEQEATIRRRYDNCRRKLQETLDAGSGAP